MIDNKTGLLKTVEMNGVSENIDQSYGVYRTYDSGAYVFRQYHQADFIVQYEGVEFTVYDGALVKEVHQQFSEYISGYPHLRGQEPCGDRVAGWTH